MVGALEATGAIGHVADAVKDVTGAELIGITWVAAFGSGVVDNIPFTTAMIPVVKELQMEAGAQGDDAYWWALALEVGLPATVLSIAIATAYIAIRYIAL
jgi:Na+/H+ antiporter NhaD/arsenite permease-like protein